MKTPFTREHVLRNFIYARQRCANSSRKYCLKRLKEDPGNVEIINTLIEIDNILSIDDDMLTEIRSRTDAE